MENYHVENVSCASTPIIHQFTFKNRFCVFCALDLEEEKDTNWDWDSFNEETFIDGVSILCEALNLKEELNGLVGVNRLDNWRLLGIDNFVQWICCDKCYKLISELVRLQQLIVKSQIYLKENARKLENFVVVSSQTHHQKPDAIGSELPSLEYSVNTCVLLREGILNNFSKKDKSLPQPKLGKRLAVKRRTIHCDKQAVILLKRLEPCQISIKQEKTPYPIHEIYDAEFTSASPLPRTIETDEDENKEDQKLEDHEYRPIKARRRSTTRKMGRSKPQKAKPTKTPGKPGRPRKTKSDSTPLPSAEQQVKRKRTRKPSFYLIEEVDSQLNTNKDKKPTPSTIPSTKGGRNLIIGSRHYRFLHEGSGPKLQAIYFLSASPSTQEENDMETYLMMYNVKFCKKSTSLHCLHPECTHQETLTGYFTDQTILRNMRFHIRFAHRSPPKKDKPEENKPTFYYCYFCESQLNSKLDLLEHRRQLHTENDQSPLFCFCEVCGDPSVAPDDLIQHVFSHKSELEKNALLNESKDKGFGKDKDILKPMDHPCDQCDKWFKCHAELMTHRNIHLPMELRFKFVCEICGKGCISARAVEHHKRRVHLRDLPVVYECHVCGKGFVKCEKNDWLVHLNRHKGEKPFQCEQCGKRFVKKMYLTKHVRLMHVGKMDKVTCEFCGKIYKTEDYLRNHCLKKHRDKVKIKRIVLGEEDKDKYKPLEQREGFIGPKLMFPCEPCGKVFIFKSMLITHLKNRHRMIYERKEDYPLQMTLEDASVVENGPEQGRHH